MGRDTKSRPTRLRRRREAPTVIDLQVVVANRVNRCGGPGSVLKLSRCHRRLKGITSTLFTREISKIGISKRKESTTSVALKVSTGREECRHHGSLGKLSP